MKGQMSIINLVALLVVELMFLTLLPVLNSFIQSTTTTLLAGPQTDYTSTTITVMDLLPFAIQIMIILTGFWIALPQPQRY